MPSKIHNKKRKDNNHDNKCLQRIRIVQDNLVFVSGLPLQLADQEVLKSELYFGRYGKVLKVVFNSSSGCRKNSVAQAYATYESQFEASLAIVALDGFNFQSHPLKASYGTTKYCSHFLKGFECHNPDCFYLHKISKQREVINGDPQNTFHEQNDRAFDLVSENLEEVIKTLIEEGEHNPDEGFPSLAEMIEFLQESKFFSKAYVQKLKQKYRHDTPPKLMPTMSSPPDDANRPRNDSPKQIKLNKCNSFSTMASPTKSQIQQKIVAQKARRSQKTAKAEKIEKQQTIKKQTAAPLEDALCYRIEKMIIKKVFQSSQKQSRLGFVNENTLKRQAQQRKKLKGIVQKCLMAHN